MQALQQGAAEEQDCIACWAYAVFKGLHECVKFANDDAQERLQVLPEVGSN